MIKRRNNSDIRKEAYLDWLADRTEHYSDQRVVRLLSCIWERPEQQQLVYNNNNSDNNDSNEDNEHESDEVEQYHMMQSSGGSNRIRFDHELKVDKAELEPYEFKIRFESWLEQEDVNSGQIYDILNKMLQYKQMRVELGEFALETPYERLVRRKEFWRRKKKKGLRRDNFNLNQDQGWEIQSEIREQVEIDSDEKRIALEERVYAQILFERGLKPVQVLQAVEDYVDNGNLLIDYDYFSKELSKEYLLEIRRIRNPFSSDDDEW